MMRSSSKLSEVWMLRSKDNMRIILIAAVFCSMMTALSVTSYAKPWKNIYPLKTTRAEVIKFLGDRTGIDEFGRAVFKTNDGTVKISWKRPDCVSKEFLLKEVDADDKSLVYQITLEPKVRFASIESYEKPEPVVVDKTDLKSQYKNWLSQDVDCLIGADSTACSLSNSKTGFGYSDHSASGITAIYYFATEDETKAFLANLAPCTERSLAKDNEL